MIDEHELKKEDQNYKQPCNKTVISGSGDGIVPLSKNQPVDPIAFLSDEEAAAEDKKVNDLFKAIRFGALKLFKLLMEQYQKAGLKGLNYIVFSYEKYNMIRFVVDGVVDYEGAKGDKLKTIIGICNGDIKFTDLTDTERDNP